MSSKKDSKSSELCSVVNRYATEEDVLKLGWLPTKERTELNLLRASHHAMYNPSWPEYLKVEKREPKRLLKGNSNIFFYMLIDKIL